MKKLLIAAAAATIISTPAFAAPTNTDSADGSATATVVAPITLTHVEGAVLNFGAFTAGGGGTVVVTRAGNGSETGEVVAVAGSTNSADQFSVSGDADRVFTISTDDGSVSDGNGNSMDFTTNAPARGTLDSSGAATFNVGGTLTVGADQVPGDYNGTYNATVTYN